MQQRDNGIWTELKRFQTPTGASEPFSACYGRIKVSGQDDDDDHKNDSWPERNQKTILSFRLVTEKVVD